MGNHMHVILRNRPDVVETWSDQEIARRIWFLFPKRKDKDGRPCDPTEFELNMLQANKGMLDQYRSRLSDISWLMRQLAEHVAIKANKEDECTGRFWEGRFKSQPLLDEAAILACAAYVDLNPGERRSLKRPKKATIHRSKIELFLPERWRNRSHNRRGRNECLPVLFVIVFCHLCT